MEAPEVPSLEVPQASLSFLTPDEESTLAEGIRGKILQTFQTLTRNYHNAVNQKQRDKASLEQSFRDAEKQLQELKAQNESLATQLQNERKTTEEYIERYRKSLTATNELEDNVRKLQTDLSDTQIKLDQLSSEKVDLVSILEKRNADLEKMNENVKNLSEQLQSATTAKIEALVKVDELTSKEMELDYREKQFQNEKGWMSKQVQLLTDELERKNNEIVEMHRQSALKLLGVQTEVSEKAEQLRLVEMQLANMKQSNEEQEAHIERLMEKLKESQELEAKMEENYRQELKSQKRIAELYKDSSEEAHKKAEEMEEAVSNLQDLLKLATERYGELETKFNKCGKSFQEEISTRDEKISNMTEELTRANELLNSMKKQSLTDEMISSLSPAAAAACSLLKNSHSLTEIYSKHQSLNEQLLAAKDENERLNNYISQILNDIEERTPKLKEQKEDYDRALETVNALQDQLDLALQSEENAIRESKMAKDQVEILHRENERLKTQMKDLAMQIKTLLREIETHRGGYVFDRSDNLTMQEVPDVSGSSSIIDSSRVISERLVTFRNIDELQAQNQYLLSLVRELSEERENAKDTIDQTHLEQIKSAFEEAKKEVSDLREARLRQERMFQGIIEQRDSYAAMLAQQKSPGAPGPGGARLSPVSVSRPFGSPQTLTTSLSEQSDKIASLEKQLIEINAAHKQLKEEYETYRKEKHEHERIASEQMERLRDDLTRMRSENAKLSSQTEYNNERGKIYAANLETYKKTINMLEEKNKQCSLTIMKHEQSIVALKAEFAEASNKLAKAEVSLSSMIQERNMLRDAKTHLEAEKNLLQKEMMTQKVLQLNLADIKNNIDMANSSAVIKLQNQIETMQKENAILRRRVDTENERFKDTVLSWDKINKETAAKYEKEKEEHEMTKKQLLEAQDTVKSQRVEIEEMLSKVRVLTGSSGTQAHGQGQGDMIPTLATIELEKKTKELNLKLIEAQTEIRSVKQQLELARASIEEYKELSNSMEQQLKSATSSRESFSNELTERLACKDDIIRDIQAKLDAIEADNSKLREENEKLQREIEGKSSTVDEELNRMRRELQVANSKLQNLTEENVAVRKDLEAQLRQTEEFRQKYEEEIEKHAQDASIQELKDTLMEMTDKFNEADRLKRKAEETSRDAKVQWEVQERNFKEQLETMQSNLAEVESLNNSLQEQLLALTTQLTSLRNVQRGESGETSMNQSFTSAAGDTSLNTSFSEQDKKTTEQWMQLIRYMRRQKEIAFTQNELAQNAMQRMETQLKFMEKQYEEVKTKLQETQDGSQVNFITSAKQAELMRKVETLSALTDSNRMLREEKEAALKEIADLKMKLEAIEKEMGPLRATNSELESKCEALNNENTSVKQDAARWRARASALLEKNNKFNPEEWKKLEQEKDNLQKQVASLSENVKKQQQEIARQTANTGRLQQQVNTLTATNTTLTNEKKGQSEELKKISDECTRVKTELANMKAELDRVNSTLAERDAELANLRQELSKANEAVEAERGIVRQVKLIARKYKKQFEDAQKENETLTEQKTSLEAAASASAAATAQKTVEHKETQENGEIPTATAPPAAAVGISTEEEATLRTEITTLQDKIQELTDTNDNLKREVENFKSREERAKSAIKAQRDKMTASNSQRSELESEVNELKAKVSSLETSKEEAEVRQAAVKSQYEGRISRLEKEKKELQASLAASGASTAAGAVGAASTSAGTTDPNAANLASENERLKNEIEMQRQRILAIEKQYKLQMTQTQAKGQPPAEKNQSEPPKANIKPIAGTKASAQTSSSSSKQATTQVVPPGTSRPQPTASIRPMSMPRKATVMPTASTGPAMVQMVQQQQQQSQQQQQQHSMISPVVPLVAPVSQAQVSTSTPDQSSSSSGSDQHQLHPVVTSGATSGTVTNSTNVRQATVQPTPAVSAAPSVLPTPTMSSAAAVATATGTAPAQQPGPIETDTVAGSEEGPTTSSQVEDSDLGDSSEQVSSSEPSNSQHAVGITPVRGEQRTSQSTQQSELQQSTSSAREEPSPSTSISGPRPTQSTKRMRTSESSHEPKDEPETKRTRINVPMPVDREAEAMSHQQEPQGGQQQDYNEADQKSAIGSASGGVQDDDGDDSDVIVIGSDDDDEEEDEEPKYQSRTQGRGRRAQVDDDEEEGEYEEDVEEEEAEEEELGDEEERVEEEEDDDEGEAGEDEDDGEGMDLQDDDESVGDPEEGREAESLEEMDESSAGQQPKFSESEAENIMIADDGQEASERVDEGQDDDDDEELDVDPESQVAEGGEASPAQEPPRFRSSGGPTSSTSAEVSRPQSSAGSSRGVPPLRPIMRRDRGGHTSSSYGRPQQQMSSSMSYSSQHGSGYGEEADDSIVPSTPTLMVPRRTDGFAEVVNSPQVPAQARFTFGSSSGMELQDARMEYMQYEDGTGRSVPTTPLQVSPPEVPDIEQQENELRRPTGSSSAQESSDIHPSSSEATPRSHDQEIPSITITSARDSSTSSSLHTTVEQPEPETESSSGFDDNNLAQRDIDVNPDDAADESVPIIQGRTESSVTSSDEDKLDVVDNTSSSTSAFPQQTSASSSSLSRPTSPTPSQGVGATSSEQLQQQQPQQHRVRPTPIIWDQPTSSSSSVQQVPQQRQQVGRGGRGAHSQAPRPMMQMQMAPDQMMRMQPAGARGGFHAQLRGAQQSARRSRPHGRGGLMRGARGGPGPQH